MNKEKPNNICQNKILSNLTFITEIHFLFLFIVSTSINYTLMETVKTNTQSFAFLYTNKIFFILVRSSAHYALKNVELNWFLLSAL